MKRLDSFTNYANSTDKQGDRMTIETTEEFLARGGKISKSSNNDISLENLLKKEGLMNDSDANNVASLVSSSISESLSKELTSKED